MRIVAAILMSLMLVGCASQQPARSTRVLHVSPDQQASAIYSPGPASGYRSGAAALAFDPPVLAGSPRLELSRADRGTAAFAGFADSSTTFTYVRTDNRQGDVDGREGGYGRHAVTETFGVSYH